MLLTDDNDSNALERFDYGNLLEHNEKCMQISWVFVDEIFFGGFFSSMNFFWNIFATIEQGMQVKNSILKSIEIRTQTRPTRRE